MMLADPRPCSFSVNFTTAPFSCPFTSFNSRFASNLNCCSFCVCSSPFVLVFGVPQSLYSRIGPALRLLQLLFQVLARGLRALCFLLSTKQLCDVSLGAVYPLYAQSMIYLVSLTPLLVIRTGAGGILRSGTASVARRQPRQMMSLQELLRPMTAFAGRRSCLERGGGTRC